MTHLHFRIIVIPKADEEPDLNALKHYVEQCDVVVHSLKRVELEKAKQFVAPEVLEYTLDVTAEDQSTISNRNKVPVYKDLIFKWNRVTNTIHGERPLLQLSFNECFVRKRISCHSNIRLQHFSFGVQARIGEYLAYATIREIFTVNFSHDLKELEIVTLLVENVNITSVEEVKESVSISYNHIRNIIVSASEANIDVYLDLLHTPLFYKECRSRPNPGFRNINRPTYRRTYHLPYGIDRETAGKSNCIHLHFVNFKAFYEVLSCLRYRSDKIPIHFTSMTVKRKNPPIAPTLNFAHFGCAYMWTAIVNRTFLILEQAANIGRFLLKLLLNSLRNGDCMEKVLTEVLFLIDSGRFVNYLDVIDKLFFYHLTKHQNPSFKDIAVPEKCRLIRRVVITPTRLMLYPADLMSENRILRNFDSDFLLRVTFRDDDFLQMNFRLYSGSVFDEVVTNPMTRGMHIGGRHYEMLAWSTSQLREHGVSMYAKDSKGYTASHIRRWTEIDPRTNMNIPKCLARIGQCFSQTEDTLHVPLNNRHVRFENDIEGGFNPTASKPYNFSDGIGKISKDLVAKVRKTLRHNKDCTAFQIRYGGCKGMLVLDPTLRGADIVFRESMRKFDCRGDGHTKLEIAKKSSPIPLRLNRPLIAILHDLGVQPRIFLRLQETMLQNLTDMLLDEVKAANYLNMRTPFSVIKFKELSVSGFCLTVEPFFRTLLLSLHRYYIDVIKTKANVEIDPASGRNMFGVLDETGKLEYGQVFVQYSRDATLGITTPEDTIILQGTVMVTKFPCVHPADVRKFTAVDIPELRHIIDCIVFPQKGPRPHPDEMAGSDLDGDEYAVIWMPELIFEQENAAPPNYPKPDNQAFKNIQDFLLQSKSEEIANFLVTYIQNDQIGSIATAHLALSDKLSIRNSVCLSIAAKHAVAVDFAKTGVSERLSRFEQPKEYPDFMEKFWKRKYKSKKSLGKMYRVSRDFETDNQATILQYHNVEVDPALVVDGWQKFEFSAVDSRNEYNSTLKTILQIYGISHEAEAFGGSFIKLHSRFRERRDRAEIVNLVQTWLKALIEKTRKDFLKDVAAPADANVIVDEMKMKASAWYIVTYREREPEFLSFPWIVSDILSDIRILKPRQGTESNPPLALKLERLILENDAHAMLPRLNSDAVFLMNSLHFQCDRSVVERAVSVLTKWGDEERIISSTYDKVLFYRTYLKLILYVALCEGYVSKKSGLPRKDDATAAALCISFFKYCMKLRFLSKAEVQRILPFQVYNERILAKISIIAFHSLAVTGVFPPLCNQQYMENSPELVDMKVVSIDTLLFGSSPIEECKLRNAESALQKASEVEYVEMRENCQRKKVIVSAYGTLSSVCRLQRILRGNLNALEIFFKTGQYVF